MSKKEYKYKPSMTTMTKGGTKQVTNKLTGKKGKLKALKLKQISAEEFDGKTKVKLKKKSGGYKKVVRK